MRTCCLAVLSLSIVVAGCSRAGDRRTDSSAGALGTAGTDTGVGTTSSTLLRDVAGPWQMIARPASGRDSTPTRVRLNATSDTAGWTMVLGNQTVPLHVRLKGDTIVTTSDEYSSVRRSGVRVTTVSSHHLEGDRLVGTTVAHYMVQGGDSVLVFRTEATRAP